jgi:endonuclease/exonuclease/phosphatase family metal-dependent hydrolase
MGLGPERVGAPSGSPCHAARAGGTDLDSSSCGREWPTARFRVLALGLLLASCGGGDGGNDGSLVVMTRNLYLGAPLEPLLQGLDPTQLPAAVGTTWRTVQSSDVPGRMERVAEEIATARADIVALQEAALYQTRSIVSTAPPATVYDFVDLLLGGLRARGRSYVAAATSTNFDGELADDTGQLIRFVDRDVVLVREGVSVSEVTTGNYVAKVGISAGPISVAIPRGWASLRLDLEGMTMRFVDTHLEIDTFASVQEAQARELVGLVQSDDRVIVAGDFNSAADGSTTASYGIVRNAGLDDPWLTLRPTDPGLTCCFAPDLREPSPPLVERIDLVLHRGPFIPSEITIVGATAASATELGVYPSDHAGVIATYRAP